MRESSVSPKLLLIEAEANIEWDGGDLAIAEANINRVRARVNMPPVTDRSREGLRKALRYERKAELCNEGFRWFDIRRWKIASRRSTARCTLRGIRRCRIRATTSPTSGLRSTTTGW